MLEGKDGAPGGQDITADSLTSAERTQREIIHFFVPDLIKKSNTAALKAAKKNHSAPDLLPEQPSPTEARDIFLTALREDRLSSTDEARYLLTLPSPLSTLNLERIFNGISGDVREKQILAILTGFTSANWQDVTAADLKQFISAPRHGQPDLRTPVGFSDLRRRFLSEIQPIASPKQFDNYIASMDHLEELLYGQRFANYREFESLRKEAFALGQDLDATSVEETNPSLESTPAATPTIAENMRETSLLPLDPEFSVQILNRSLVEGDPWIQGGNSYQLGISSLVSAGLTPKYKIRVDNQQIYLSPIFMLTSEQPAVIAYIETPNGFKSRSFYRDKNQALWRYLPDYIRNMNGEGIDVFGSGYDERSVILPILLQSALNQIEHHRDILDLSTTNPDFLFAGTAHAYASRQEYRDTLSHNLMRGDFYREVSHTAFNSTASVITEPGHRKISPQLLTVTPSTAPNFERLFARFSVYSSFAGQIMGDGYVSVDAASYWLFFSDYRGRCWVANIETNSPVTSTGCRQEWNLETDIATPLYESLRLADGYGNPADTRAGNHISMWENYLSRIPLIEQYVSLLAAENQQ